MTHEEGKILFRDHDLIVAYGDIVKKLKEIGADQCDVLFVHSDISFGVPEKGLKRKELNQLLLDAILEMKNDTLIFPTFTFSFCNKEDYNIQNSPTTMGMLPEYVRKLPNVLRTNDPIMSVAILGEHTEFDKMKGMSSCGEGGIFHQLHNSNKKVKFLFFGVSPMKCFTFLHYVEEINKVPYRYSRDFTGNVIDGDVSKKTTISLYVRYKDVVAVLPSGFSEGMEELGFINSVSVGQSSITIIDEKESYDYISGLIAKDPYVFAKMPQNGSLIKEYDYGNVKTM